MADESSKIFQMKAGHGETKPHIAMGMSASLGQERVSFQSMIGTQPDSEKIELGFSGIPKDSSEVQSGCFWNQDSRGLKNKKQDSSCSALNSTGNLGSVRNVFDVSESFSEIMGAKHDGKRRCYEKKVGGDLKCALKIEVIDDTALIEATAAVSGFKSGRRDETEKIGKPKKSLKQGIDGKKKNKKNKKQGKGFADCSIKCVNEKNFSSKMLKDQSVRDKKISEAKIQNVSQKREGKLKMVYRMKGLKLVAASAEEQKKGKEVPTESGNQDEPSTQLVKNQTICEKKDDGFDSKMDVVESKKYETGEGDRCGKGTDESKKMAYSREEMEMLRFVDEEKQKKKWTEVYCGLSPAVAKEYNTLLVDLNNRQSQRDNRMLSSGITRHAILSRPPPVLPLCSLNCRYVSPYGHVVSR